MSNPIPIHIVSTRILIQQAVTYPISQCTTLPMKAIPCAVGGQKDSKVFARVIDLYHLADQQIDFWTQDAITPESGFVQPVTIAIKPDVASCPSNIPYISENQSVYDLVDILVDRIKARRYVISPIVANARKRLDETARIVQPLSPREQDVMMMVELGLSNKEIAGALQLQESTIKAYLKSIFQKYHVSNRLEATLVWGRNRTTTFSNII